MSNPSETTRDHEREHFRSNHAQKVVAYGGVKLNRFMPSGLELWTVAGRECEYFVDCVPQARQYCTCDDFHYRALSGKIEECYHLLAAKKAMHDRQYTLVEFPDDDLQTFFVRLLAGIFANIS